MISYKIARAVTFSGSPTWKLLSVFANQFAVSEIKIAENPDRAVLERAIEHLQASDDAKDSQPGA